MRKIVSILLALVILFSILPSKILAFADSSSPTPFPSSYELFYPVVAGKIPGDRFYKLKLLKEWFTGKLIFNSIRKTD
ncbi:MAG: hypothetical protein ABH812_00665, partial [bacterium]